MALTQVSSEGIKDAQVKTADILDANITTAKVADNAITGAKVADNLDIPDNNKIRFGTGNDLELYHTGSHGYILNKTGNLVIRAKDGETGIEVIPDGAVELRHNNVKRLETTAGGIKVTGGTGQAALDVWATSGNDAYLKLVTDAGVNAPDYYQVLHQNSDNSLRIQNYGDGSYEDNIVAKHGGAVELYYDNAKKFETTSYGTRVYGNLENHDDYIKVHDAGKLVAGNSDDLQISHNGSNSVIQNTTGNLYLLPDSGGYGLALDANGASKLYYDGSKKFETTSDGGKITGDLQISNDVLISDHIKHHGDTNTALRFPAADTFTVETAGSERLRIDSSGRVFTGGVSTQPSGDNRTLNLCSTSTTEAGLSFSRSSSTMGSGNTSGQTIRLDTDGSLTFNVHNVGEKLRIDSSGKVGIGTTNPGEFNDGADQLVIQNSGSCGITIDATSGTNSNLFFADGATGSEAYRGYVQYSHPTDTLRLGASGANELEISTGSVKVTDGNLVIGGAGHGISFINAADTATGETVSSSVLDDYEEGTFNPTLGGQLNGQSYDHQYGHYTKIGNMVTCHVEVNLAGDPGSHSSNVSIGDLPFTAATLSGIPGAGIVGYNDGFVNDAGVTGNFTGMVNSNNNYMRFYKTNGTYLNWDDIDDRSNQIRVLIIYRT